MKIYRAGDDVVAHCGRCKLDLMHVVHAEVEGRPARVECKTCHAVHRYRAPQDAGRDAPPRARAASTTPRTTSAAAAGDPKKAAGSRRRSSAPSPAEVYAKLMADRDPAEARPYRMEDTFTVGELINHRMLGVGLVTEVQGKTRLEVVFESGTELLVHNRA